jgi:hypothetical protein
MDCSYCNGDKFVPTGHVSDVDPCPRCHGSGVEPTDIRDRLHKIGPLTEPLPPVECPGCRKPFAVGEYATLVMIGPGDDAVARERCLQGRAYNAICVPVHWACATGGEP